MVINTIKNGRGYLEIAGVTSRILKISVSTQRNTPIK